MSRWRPAAGLALAALLTAPPAAAPRAFDPAAFLRQQAKFSANDISKLQRGEVVAHGLDADGDEVAISAAASVDVPPAQYLARYRDIGSFRTSQQLLGAGRFSPVPTAADMRTLNLTEQDVSDARDCRLGDCKLKLDERGIARLRQVDLRGSDARTRLAQMFREHLAAYAAEYRRSGDAAFMHYADGGRHATIRDSLTRTLDRMPFLFAMAPRMAAAMRHYGGGTVADVEEFLYWSQDQVGRKPVISINHAFISQPSPDLTIVATRQVYASHYFTGSVNVTLLSAADQQKAPMLMIHINRSRIDAFHGVLGGVRRTLARTRSRSAAERMLGALRTTLESGR